TPAITTPTIKGNVNVKTTRGRAAITRAEASSSQATMPGSRQLTHQDNNSHMAVTVPISGTGATAQRKAVAVVTRAVVIIRVVATEVAVVISKVAVVIVPTSGTVTCLKTLALRKNLQ